MARRPIDEWRREVEEEAELARGNRSPEQAYARILWPESLRSRTDAALAGFEAGLHALAQPSDEEILSAVERLVLTLNKINEDQVRVGETGYETDEREQLCDYISASLREAGIDVASLEIRHGAQPVISRGCGATGKPCRLAFRCCPCQPSCRAAPGTLADSCRIGHSPPEGRGGALLHSGGAIRRSARPQRPP